MKLFIPFNCNECVEPLPITNVVPALFTEVNLELCRKANLISDELSNDDFYPYNCHYNCDEL